MLQIVIGTIIAFLAVAGIAEIASCVQELLYMPPQEKITFLVTSRGHDDKIEYVVRSLIFKARAFHSKMTPVIIIVNEGMDEETMAICEKLSDVFDCLHVCTSQEVIGMLQ